MAAYYNEFDPFAAAWLRELVTDGVIAPGDVDERSITEVHPDDLRGYTQCHFFAGIGGWSYAARLAGLPDDFPLWTGSCPCQPFSAAGKQQGEADARHLWPEFRRLIAECRPAIAVGEQVASALGRDWLAGVRADLEGMGYAVGAADLCAASAGAPHIRQRLFWVADAGRFGGTGRGDAGNVGSTTGALKGEAWQRKRMWDAADDGGAVGGLDHPTGHRARCPDAPESSRDGTHDGLLGEASAPGGLADADGGFSRNRGLQPGGEHGQQSQDGGAVGGVADTESPRSGAGLREGDEIEYGHGLGGGGGVGDPSFGGLGIHGSTPGRPGHADQPTPVGGVEYALCEGRTGEPFGLLGASDQGYWADFTLLPCRDGKARRTQSGLFPLVDGLPRGLGSGGDPRRPVSADEAQATREARVMRLRGYGNAIVPQVAALFLRAFLDSR